MHAGAGIECGHLEFRHRTGMGVVTRFGPYVVARPAWSRLGGTEDARSTNQSELIRARDPEFISHAGCASGMNGPADTNASKHILLRGTADKPVEYPCRPGNSQTFRKIFCR
jgi:hypothetical protein